MAKEKDNRHSDPLEKTERKDAPEGANFLDVFFEEAVKMGDRLGFDKKPRLNDIALAYQDVARSTEGNILRRSIVGLSGLDKGLVMTNEAGLILTMGIGPINAKASGQLARRVLFVSIVRLDSSLPDDVVDSFDDDPESTESVDIFLRLMTPHAAEGIKDPAQRPSGPIRDSSIVFSYDYRSKETIVIARIAGIHDRRRVSTLNSLFKRNTDSRLSVKQDPLAPSLRLIEDAIKTSND